MTLQEQKQRIRGLIHTNPLEAKALIAGLFKHNQELLDDILYDWDLWVRPDQQIELAEGKDTTLLLCGRGFGKTRFVSQKCIELAKNPENRVLLMAADFGNLKKSNFLGPAGIISCLHPSIEYEFNKADLILSLKDGGTIISYSAEAFDKTRSAEASHAVLDEVAAWQYAQQGLDAAQALLRSGKNPHTYIATTPRPTQIVRDLIKSPSVQVIKGTTYDNYFLTPKYVEALKEKLTDRMFRQECLAEVLDDNPYALFKRESIDTKRVSAGKLATIQQDMAKIVIGVDPAGSTNATSDMTGIIAAGIDANDHGYVIEDRTIKGTPNEWGSAAVQLYHKYKANSIVVETNYGGDMVEHTIKTIDPNVHVTKSHAARAKDIRAEPVAALYEQGKVSHVGMLKELEDELCEWDPTDKTMKSPNRLDAMVWALRDLMLNNNNFFVDII